MSDFNSMHLGAARRRLSELCDELIDIKWWNLIGFYSVITRIKFIYRIIKHFEGNDPHHLKDECNEAHETKI